MINNAEGSPTLWADSRITEKKMNGQKPLGGLLNIFGDKVGDALRNIVDGIHDRLSELETQVSHIQETMDSLFVSPDFQKDIILKGKKPKEGKK